MDVLTSGLHSALGSSSRTWITPAKPKHHSFLDDLTDNKVVSFLGNLTDDVVHTSLGIPGGLIAMMTTNPLTTAEGMAKATWHDWSPLFHGEFGKWGHQTFEHPLAPILDIASVLSGGAALSAKGAGLAARAGELAAATEDGQLAARTGRLAHYANPSKARLAVHEAEWKRLHPNASPETVRSYARDTVRTDPQAYRTVSGEAVRNISSKAISNNPLNRLMERQIDRGLSAIGKSDWATKRAFTRWAHLDRGARKAATADLVGHQISGFADAGKVLDDLHPSEYITDVHERSMRPIIEHQAHEIDITHLFTKKGGRWILDEKKAEAHMKAVARDRYQALKARKSVSLDTVNGAISRALAAGKSKIEALHAGLNEWAPANVTDVFSESEIVKRHGRVFQKVVSRSDKAKAAGEFGNTARLAHLLYHKPTQVWKYLVLGAAPRYMVNNVVGNTFMLMMSADPVTLTRAFLKHMGDRHGTAAAQTAELDGALAAAAGRGASARELKRLEVAIRADHKIRGATTTAEEVGSEFESFSLNQSRELKAKSAGQAENRLKAGALYLPRKNFEYTHKFSDVTHRNIIANYSMNRTPEFQSALAAAEKRGLKGNEARMAATKEAYQSAAVRQVIRNDMRHVLGQYHTFDTWEQGVKNVVPFYSWTRAISRHTQTLMQTAPYKVAMLTSIGEQGHDASVGMIGQVPDFLQGALPLSELEKLPGGKVVAGAIRAIGGSTVDGRQGLLLTSGLNPYASLADIMTTGKGLVGGTPRVGDTVGGQINPVLKGMIETFTGTSMVSGAPIDVQGGALNIYLGQAENLPLTKLIQQITGQNAPAADTKLFADSNTSVLSSFLGAPTRSMSNKEALDLYRKQRGIKKPPGIKGLPQMPQMPGM